MTRLNASRDITCVNCSDTPRIYIVGLVNINRYVCSIKLSSIFHDRIVQSESLYNELASIIFKTRRIRFYFSVGEII